MFLFSEFPTALHSDMVEDDTQVIEGLSASCEAMKTTQIQKWMLPKKAVRKRSWEAVEQCIW